MLKRKKNLSHQKTSKFSGVLHTFEGGGSKSTFQVEIEKIFMNKKVYKFDFKQ